MMGQVQGLETDRRAFEHAARIGEPVAPATVDQGFTRSDALSEGVAVEAAVKWFSAAKGYGFVELAGGGDAFLHLKALREIGRQTLPLGAKVRVVVRTGPRGAEVVRIVEVDASSAIERSPRRSALDLAAAFGLTGKVKWFDYARGYGFIASDDFGRDVFVHGATLGACGVQGLLEGQAVSMRVVDTPKGREAIAIVLQPESRS